MIKFKHTNRALADVGKTLRVKLQDELKFQKHNATGRLSRGLKYNITKRGMSVLNITSSVLYWRAVNNPEFAKIPNLNTIQRWMGQRSIKGGMNVAVKILKRLSGGNYKIGGKANYGNKTYPNNNMRQPYITYEAGNKVRRTNFAGYVANKFSKDVAKKLAPSIGVDVANMIADKIRKNNPKTNVVEAF